MIIVLTTFNVQWKLVIFKYLEMNTGPRTDSSYSKTEPTVKKAIEQPMTASNSGSLCVSKPQLNGLSEMLALIGSGWGPQRSYTPTPRVWELRSDTEAHHFFLYTYNNGGSKR